jgi:hypothetical protein
MGFGQAIVYRSDRDQLMPRCISSLRSHTSSIVCLHRCVRVPGASVKVLGNRVKSTSVISSGGEFAGLGLDWG